MKHLFCLFSIFNLFILIIPVSAQNNNLSGARTQEQAENRSHVLVLDVTSSVLENGKKIWSESIRRTSISGIPVGVQLAGSNVVVVVQFIPYIRRDSNVLVVQGQIWVSDPEKKDLTYFTSTQTIPMEFNEPVYFFPLGEAQYLNPSIEIIIKVNPYNGPRLSTRADTNSGNAKQ